MRLLLDQDVYAVTARFLTELGHDVVTAADIDGSRSSDIDLLRAAYDQSRVFVTRDKDFGSLVFIRDFKAGVVFLRLLPANIQVVHQELARVLAFYTENQLKDVPLSLSKPDDIASAGCLVINFNESRNHSNGS